MSSKKTADWQEEGSATDNNTTRPGGTSTPSAPGGNVSSTGRTGSQKQVEKIVLQFLKAKGYKDAEKALRENASLDGLESTIGDLANAFPASEVGADASVPNWIMFYSEAEEGNPDAYAQSYGELRRWIDSSLDVYKHELYAASYPIFVNSYLDLLGRGLEEKAAEFMTQYRGDHIVHHGKDINVLATLKTGKHAEENELAKLFRANKYGIRMTRVGFELLLSFLQDHSHTLLMRTVNQHLNIRTIDGTVTISSEAEADVGVTGHTQSQIDSFNSQDISLGSAPMDARVREEVERTLQSEIGKRAKDAAGREASALLDSFNRIKQDNAANALTSREAIPMPPARDADIEHQLASLKALRKRVALGPAALPSICMYTLHNTNGTLNCTTVSEDLSLLAGGFSESYIKLWSLRREPLRGFQSNFYPGSLHSEESIERVREKTTADHRRLIGHSGAVFGLDTSFDSRYLVSCSEDRTARLWSLDTYTNVVCYRGHSHPIWDVAFAPQGFYFATASHDRTARLWSCDHIYALRIFAGHLADVNCVKFHPNAKYVVTGSSDRSVRLWDVQRGSCVRVFTGHTGSVDTVAISPDGRIMASAGEDQTVSVWDLGSGRRMDTFTGHTGPVYSLAFSQEGTLLLSGGADETVRAWDVKRSTTASDHPIITQRREEEEQQERQKQEAVNSSSGSMDVDEKQEGLAKPATNGTGAVEAAGGSSTESKKRDAAGLWKAKRVNESEALLKTWRTKSTPVYSILMTKRNLAVTTGAFTPSSSL
ncbi:Transcription initiation factor TFIID subunit 5 [Coemansia sp. Benny D115]|nr:Transcription initiation factor TFIID subunit 5 [Coemansia sp. Benny D115]